MKKYDSKVWGPHYWFFLHTIAMSYPAKANDVIKKKYYELIQNMQLFIPNEKEGNEFRKLVDMYPIAPYLDTREAFVRWTHYIHNKMNEKLEKPKITLEEFYRQYYELYKPNDVKLVEYVKLRQKIIFSGLIIATGGLIYYLYDK